MTAKKNQAGQAAAQHSAVPYPADFPREEVQTLIAAAKDPAAADPGRAVHCGWVVLGYGLGIAYPDDHPAALAAAAADEPLDALLQKTLAVHAGGQGAGALPWKGMARMILGLILQLLG